GAPAPLPMAGFPAIPGTRRSAPRALPFAVITRSHAMATQSQRSRSIFVFVIAVALATATPLWAQSTATLQGAVTDAQGAIVPGATVVAVNEETGVQRQTLSDSAGNYQMASLPTGSYRLEASLTGFQPRVVKGIRLEVARTVVQNLQLSLAGVAEEV